MSEKRVKSKKDAVLPEVDPADDSAEEQGKRRPSRLFIVLITIAAIAFAVYSVISLVGIHAQISERRRELGEIQDEITVQEIKNEEMNKTYSLSDKERSEYIEQIARDELDYVKEGERVFVNVAGD